jgi:hypothetical protein
MRSMSKEDAQESALALCRGCYQRAVVRGRTRLRATDENYAPSRWKSRNAIIRRIQQEGIPCCVAGGDGEPLHLLWGSSAVRRELRKTGLTWNSVCSRPLPMKPFSPSPRANEEGTLDAGQAVGEARRRVTAAVVRRRARRSTPRTRPRHR